MKIKVSEATPLQLNWLVAKCEGLEIESILQKHHIIVWKPDTLTEEKEIAYVFSPTTDWSQSGPIIERNIGRLEDLGDEGWEACGFGYVAIGDTPLIAAMRHYVMVSLGDEVEIPKELL